MFIEKKRIAKLPKTPGVYTYYKVNIPIYIGKALNLRNRISSYFTNNLDTKTKKMVNEAERLSFIKVKSEFEALLLEAKLIKKYRPKYNIVAKDDKQPLYIKITKELYPRVITVRKSDKLASRAVFGPFPSSGNVYSVLRMLRRIFPYSEHKLGKRACLHSHIGLCKPCPNQIANTQDSLEKKFLRKQYLQNINHILKVLSGSPGSVLKSLERRMYGYSKKNQYELAAAVRDQIKKLEYITQPRIQEDEFIKNPNLYEDLRRKEVKGLQILLQSQLSDLRDLSRIECYDVSHTAGTYPTASMVSFVNGEADKSLYRHFRIKQKKSQSDYDSMREVARRRRLNLGAWGKPDLIVVDGGIGQVKVFSQAFAKDNIAVVGIAKNPDRVVFSDGTKIRPTGPALFLLQKMRDEAHRFARAYHAKLLDKRLFPKDT